MGSITTYLPWLTWIDSQCDRMIALVQELAQINSGSYHQAGIDRMRAALRTHFSPIADSVLDVAMAPRMSIDQAGNTQSAPTPNGLSVRNRPSAPIQLLLNGHMDTVFGPESPFQSCRFLSPDRLNGPGVADLKGGLVIMLIALEALERSPWKEKIGWEAFFNPDEEIGSVGSTPYLQERAPHYDVGIIVEPQFSDGAFVSARKGSTAFALVSRGKSAHAGRDFHQGVNAIAALALPLQHLHAINSPGASTTLNIGMIRGGTASNIVPDLAIVHFGIRASTEEELLTTKDSIYRIIEEANTQGADLQLYQLSDRCPKPFDTATQQLFNEVKVCADLLGIPMSWRESGGVCDGNTLAAMGLPTIDSMGAAGGKIHTEEEYIEIGQLTERAKHLALLLLRIASGEHQIAFRG